MPPERTLQSRLRVRESRLLVEVLADASTSHLEEDVRSGLTASCKAIPPKYFYDAEGSLLFDAICTTPEYYPTRTEDQLLQVIASDVIDRVRPTHIVELGSGAARKTERLLDAAARSQALVQYAPFDVSETMLRESAGRLLQRYVWLTVHGVVGDYTRHLERVPAGQRRLILFLGGTIGNFTEASAVQFLTTLRATMRPNDRLLLGMDLIKDTAILNAAYNDARGLTAAFNKNVLRVLNRELAADFRFDAFEHSAFFDTAKSQIEMHLVSTERQTVRLPRLDLAVAFDAGETILTEISRKFSSVSARSLLERAGLSVIDFHTPENEYFALVLARPTVPQDPGKGCEPPAFEA